MKKNELKSYLEENLSNYTTFIDKAMKYQIEKNNKRKNKWNDYRLEKEVSLIWNNISENIFNQLKIAAKNKNCSIYEYIVEYDVIDSINDSLNEIEFE